jgi:methyl-accepting chemotaxis protein
MGKHRASRAKAMGHFIDALMEATQSDTDEGCHCEIAEAIDAGSSEISSSIDTIAVKLTRLTEAVDRLTAAFNLVHNLSSIAIEESIPSPRPEF